MSVQEIRASAIGRTAPRTGPARAHAPAAAVEHPSQREAPRSPGVVRVSRDPLPWRWPDLLLVPVEVVAVAWGLSLVMLLVVVPMALAIAFVLWLGQFGLRHF